MTAPPVKPHRVLPPGSPFASHWRIDPGVVFLNHGSFGNVPYVVSEHQREVQLRLQREPVRFFVEQMEPMLDDAKLALAELLACPAEDVAFVLNATMGVNVVIRSLPFEPGDEIVTSTHEYNACNNVVEWAASRWGVKVTRVVMPFPISGPDEAYERIIGAVTGRTKLVMVSHVTSSSGMILPVERIVGELNRRGVDTLVDGAHATGMIPLRLDRLAAPYYTGNLHKWVCAPNGAAFLYVRPDRQHLIRPAVISHGANSPRTDRSRFRLEFDYIGTTDPSPWLSVPAALRFMAGLGAGLPPSTPMAPLPASASSGGDPAPLRSGWERVMRANRAKALEGRRLLCDAFGVAPSVPDEMIGSLGAVQLPTAARHRPLPATRYHDGLQEVLIRTHGIQVPVYPAPVPEDGAGARPRVVRISAQLYNSLEQYEYLARALRAELA